MERITYLVGYVKEKAGNGGYRFNCGHCNSSAASSHAALLSVYPFKSGAIFSNNLWMLAKSVFYDTRIRRRDMAKLWIGLTVAAILVGGKLVSAHSNMPDTLQGREEFLAQGINKAAPIPTGPYISMTGAKVSDVTLEIDSSMSPTTPKIKLDNAFKSGVVFGACKAPMFRDLINRGGSLRLVVTAADGNTLPVSISSSDCPTS